MPSAGASGGATNASGDTMSWCDTSRFSVHSDSASPSEKREADHILSAARFPPHEHSQTVPLVPAPSTLPQSTATAPYGTSGARVDSPEAAPALAGTAAAATASSRVEQGFPPTASHAKRGW